MSGCVAGAAFQSELTKGEKTNYRRYKINS
jgi:hypothetical protein